MASTAQGVIGRVCCSAGLHTVGVHDARLPVRSTVSDTRLYDVRHSTQAGDKTFSHSFAMNMMALIKHLPQRAILALALTGGFDAVYAQDSFVSLDEAKTSLAKVIDEFVSHDQSEALRKLPRMTTSRSDEEQRLAIQRFIQFNLQTSEKRGPASSYKYLSTITISEFISRVRFIVLAERLPLTMDFYLYKPVAQSNWKLCDLSFATGPKVLFATEDQPQSQSQVVK